MAQLKTRAHYALWAANSGDIQTAKNLRAILEKDWQHWNKHTRNLYKSLFNEIDTAHSWQTVMILRAVAYFCALYTTSTAFSYFAFGKHVIETHGYMGGTATLNKLDDFLILCLSSCLFILILFAAIYFTIAKSYQYFSKKAVRAKTPYKSQSSLLHFGL